MDFVIPLPETAEGNSGILNVVYKLSKMIRIIPIKSSITAFEVAINSKNGSIEIMDCRQRSFRIVTAFSYANFGKPYLRHLVLSWHYQPRIILKQTANRESRTEKSRR